MSADLMRLTKDELVDLARDTGWDGDPDDVTKRGLVERIERAEAPPTSTNVETVFEDDTHIDTVPPEAPPVPQPVVHGRSDRDPRTVGPARTR